MVQEVAEKETAQSLETVIAESSTESEEVSGETVGDVKTPEVIEGETKVEPEIDFETRVSKEVQSRSDKLINEHRTKRETDLAHIRELTEKVKEATRQSHINAGNDQIAKMLAGDAEEGYSEEQTKSRKAIFEQFIQRETAVREKSKEVEEAAGFISSINEQMPGYIVKEFGLDDANPNIRAKNGAKFINEAISLHQRNVAFAEGVELFLTKGTEVRKDIENFTNEWLELSDSKGRDLLKEKIRSGLKVTPKKPPPAPSGGGGGNKGLEGKTVDELFSIAYSKNK